MIDNRLSTYTMWWLGRKQLSSAIATISSAGSRSSNSAAAGIRIIVSSLSAAGIILGAVWTMGSSLSTRNELSEIQREMRLDNANLKKEVKTELSELKKELKTDLSEMRKDNVNLKKEVKTELSELKKELKTDLSEVKKEFKMELSEVKKELKTDLSEMRKLLESFLRK